MAPFDISTPASLLDVCESELQYLDMSINVNKSVCPGLARVMHSPVVTYLLRMLARLFGVSLYLGVYFVSSKSLKRSLSNSQRSFYRSFNAIFGKVGWLAAEPVTVELLKSKCLPSLYHR